MTTNYYNNNHIHPPCAASTIVFTLFSSLLHFSFLVSSATAFPLRHNGHMVPRASSSLRASSADVPILSAEEIARSLWTTTEEGGGLFDTDVHGVLRCNGNDDDDDGGGTYDYRLLYMPMRNRGELLRLILEESRVPYEVEVVGFRNWADDGGGVKATTPHGKCPVLRTRAGLEVAQEGAITRYLADAFGLAGDTPERRAEVDALYCLWFATLRNHGVSHDGDHFSIAALKEAVADDTVSSLRRPRYEDVQRLQALHEYSRAEVSLLALDFFERQLGKYHDDDGDGWLVGGDTCTYVDLGLFYVLWELPRRTTCRTLPRRSTCPVWVSSSAR